MNLTLDDGGPVAVIADVHGNRWALEAVLEDLERRAVRHVLNLGDSLYGPLDPAGAAELLRHVNPMNVQGNQDRILLEPPTSVTGSPTFQFVVDELTDDHLEWLREHKAAPLRLGPLALCHGTPERDDQYLIEEITEHGVRLKGGADLARELAALAAEVILCAHSHVPRLVGLPDGRQVVNPGSVGLPAYTDDSPFAHGMEAGSPHARYVRLERSGRGWRIEHVALAYDWERAAVAAEQHGRSDWAGWLRSGRAA